MANAALVIDNNADNGAVSASSEETTMPARFLLTPSPSERWRSLSGTASFVLDKGQLLSGDTVMVAGLTCGVHSTVRFRLSTDDSSGVTADVADSGLLVDGSLNFSTEYAAAYYLLSSPDAWRYMRVDISDPSASFVEAGSVLDGLRETFTYNFDYAGGIQHVDRSRLATTSAGLTQTWNDNTFRRLDLSFPWITAEQRYGVIERMDRRNGRHKNVLLMTDTDSDNLPRDSIFGLLTDLTPITFTSGLPNMFGKQIRIDERI